MDSRDSFEPNLPARFTRPSYPAPVFHDRPTPDEGPRPVSLRAIFRGLTRYWWQILLLWTVASTAAVGLVYARVRPSYEAIGMLRVEPGSQDLFGVRGGADTATFLETQVNLLKSTSVLALAANDPKVAALSRIRTAQDATVEIRTSLEIAAVPSTNLIKVAMRSTSPGEAALIVNAVMAAFITFNAESSENLSGRSIAKLEAYENSLKTTKEEKYQKWKELAQKQANAQVSGGAGNKAAADKAMNESDFQQGMATRQKIALDLMDAEIALSQLEAVPASTNAAESERLLEDRVHQAMMSDQTLSAMYDDMKKLEAKMLSGQKVIKNTETDPALRKTKNDLINLIKDYNAEKEARRASYRKSMAVTDSKPALIGSVKKKIEILRKNKLDVEEKIKKLEVVGKQQAGETVDIQMAQADLNVIQEMLTSVGKRLEQLRYDAKGDARITVADPAVAQSRPTSDGRPKLMVAAPVAVLAALMGLFVMLELRSGRVGHPDDLRVRAEIFTVPPLPTLQGSKNARNRGDQVEHYTQRIDHLRVALCGETTTGTARCMLITSATGGEGKTTLAVQLAGRCANAGLTTLLIDADLRRPKLGELLEIPDGPGLADVLAGEAEVESAMVVVGSAGGFHLLPAGRTILDPSRILRGGRLGQMIAKLRLGFDVVIIDTPPVLPVPDALTIGACADGAILAVRRDASRMGLVERANRMLAAANVPVLGVVVNGVRANEMGYGGYSSYASAGYSSYMSQQGDHDAELPLS